MQITSYKSGDHTTLSRLCTELPSYHNLCYPDFVDYYYGSTDWCKLWMMQDDSERVFGVVGVEKMPFSTPAGDVELGFGSNFYAFQSGAGAFLFLHWARECDFGIQFGGSEDARRLVDHQKWTRLTGIQTLQMNAAWAEPPGEANWRRAAKLLLRHIPLRTRVDSRAREMLRQGGLPIEAVPETCFTSDMRVKESAYDVRFNPGVDYLNWRYATDLEFVRYHVFRLVLNGQTCGSVVLNEQPHRVLVSHADASDPWVLSQGIFAALARVCTGRMRGCGVMAVSSCPVIQSALTQAGFSVRSKGRDIAIGGPRKQPGFTTDTSQWLINFDWGDNGLRAPFLGQSRLEQASAAA